MSRDLYQLIDGLPKSLQQEVMNFIASLIKKSKSESKPSTKKPREHFKWEGSLKRKYNKISSVELQHKIWD